MTTDTYTDEYTLTPREGSSGAWADLEADVYPAELTDLVLDAPSQKYPENGPQYKLTFTLEGRQDEEGNPIALNRWVNRTLSTAPKMSKLAEFATALGMPPVVGRDFHVRDLIGRHCKLVVNLRDTANGPRPFIASLLPAATAVQPKKAAAVQPKGEELGPCFVCAKPGTAYDGHGREVCEKHKNIEL